MIQSVMGFLGEYSVAMAALCVAILDFAIAVNPKLQANSLIQLVLDFLKKKQPPPAG